MVFLENIILDVTKNCNLKCAHCCRGEACNENLNLDILPKIFNENVSIRNLQLSGGEVFLNSKLFEQIIDFIVNSGCNIQILSIITNGTCYSDEIKSSLEKMYNYILSCNPGAYYQNPNEIVSIEISTDYFHHEEINKIKDTNYALYKQYLKNAQNLTRSKFFDTFRENDIIVRQGRAKNLDDSISEPYIMDIIYTEDNESGNLNVWSIEIETDGKVRKFGDLEGESVGNILTTDLRKIIKSSGIKCEDEIQFNNKINNYYNDIMKLKYVIEIK